MVVRTLSHFSIREQTGYLAFSFFLFSVSAIVFRPAGIGLNAGQSMLWLLICFTWGNILKNLAPRIRKWKYHGPIFLFRAILCALIPFFYHWLQMPYRWRLMSYLSPFCVIQAASLLLLFEKIQIRNERTQKVLAFFSTYSLGIYLLQAQPVIWENFIVRTVTEPATVLILWKIPALVLGISAAGILIYYLTAKLYSNLFR